MKREARRHTDNRGPRRKGVSDAVETQQRRDTCGCRSPTYHRSSGRRGGQKAGSGRVGRLLYRRYNRRLLDQHGDSVRGRRRRAVGSNSDAGQSSEGEQHEKVGQAKSWMATANEHQQSVNKRRWNEDERLLRTTSE